MQARRDRPLVVIDIAVPRDVEARVRHLSGVVLRDIDDLERVAHANLSGRFREARQAEAIVERELRRLTSRGSVASVTDAAGSAA